MSDKVKMTRMQYEADRPMAEDPVKVMDLSLRDGHQSLFATRGRTEDMIPVAELMDEIGFWALETWGGATFDAMHRFLNEDPWQRLRTLKRYIKKTPFSMLLRAQNLVGYRNYGDDLVEAFVDRAVLNGMDVFRVFDALNDYRNFETVVRQIKKNDKHFQGCICYSLTEPRLGGEVYSLEYYRQKAEELQEMGADSICIKDMAGLMAPYDAYELIKELKSRVTVPIHLHSHFTSGMSPMTHLKAIEAGVDIVDTCLSPYAYRTSHAAVEPLVMALLGTSRDTGFDIKKLARITAILEKEVMPKYKHLLNESRMSIIDINVLLHQTPGGMLSNLVNQLREMDALDRLDEVYKELPRVRRELGQIPLVTPTSQIVGVQTVNNVLHDTPDERYTMITGQVKDLCYGLYGKTAVPIDGELQKKALTGYPRGETPITGRPAEVLEPELDKAKAEIGDLAKDIDDQILYALFPVTGRKFLEWKYGVSDPPDSVMPVSLDQVNKRDVLVKKALAGKLYEKPENPPPKSRAVRTFNVFIDDEFFTVDVDPQTGVSEVVASSPEVPAAPAPVPSSPRPARGRGETSAPATVDPAVKVNGTRLEAPMPGLVVRLLKKVGERVAKGETVLVLEAMKMENSLVAPCGGTIEAVNFKVGDSVVKGETLAVIG